MESAVKSAMRFGTTEYELRARTHIMGILNVTPDSFSDGGDFYSEKAAIERGLVMAGEGADFIDVGGESTRPGSAPVSAEEEIRRVIPVIEGIAKRTSVPLSVDTTKGSVAGRALDAGAVIVNDISGLHADPSIAGIAGRKNAALILMHMKGTPATMQDAPEYADVMEEIVSSLRNGIDVARSNGVRDILVDPGIGFGKSVRHNTDILRRLREMEVLGCPVLVGPSRKSFIGKILDLPVGERLEGTAAAVAVAIMNGASIVRVHDVTAMKRVAKVVDEILSHNS